MVSMIRQVYRQVYKQVWTKEHTDKLTNEQTNERMNNLTDEDRGFRSYLTLLELDSSRNNSQGVEQELCRMSLLIKC